jgi:hypothetical protein
MQLRSAVPLSLSAAFGMIAVIAPPALAADPTTVPGVSTTTPSGLVAETIRQNGASGLSNPTVRPVILALVALAVLMVGITVWFWRVTVPEPDALDRLRKVPSAKQ